MDLAHLAQRRGHHPRRENPLEAGEQVLGPAHSPRIGNAFGPAGRPPGARLPLLTYRPARSRTESCHVLCPSLAPQVPTRRGPHGTAASPPAARPLTPPHSVPP